MNHYINAIGVTINFKERVYDVLNRDVRKLQITPVSVNTCEKLSIYMSLYT